MEKETEDQGQEGTQDEQANKEQSETTSEEDVNESKLFKLPDGREVTADDLYKEHTENLLPEFTRRSQKLSEYEKASAEEEARVKSEAQKALDDNPLLDNVDPNVKAAIEKIALNQLEKYIQDNNAKREAEEQNREWDRRFTEAGKTHDGKDGLPKFVKDDVYKFMREKEIYDPEVAYREMNMPVIMDKMIQDALKGKDAPSGTEDTGGSPPRKPKTDAPETIDEASNRAYDRLNS
jgi:hypothetical protein